MTIVYGKTPYAYVYGDNNGTHKQGKVYPEQPMSVEADKGKWLSIEPLELDRPIDPNYPDFWIKSADTVAGHDGEPTEDPLDDLVVTPEETSVAMAIITIIKWLKS